MRNLLLVVILIFMPAAFAQGWPERPVRVIVTGGPGSPSDTLARLMANHLQGKLGQPFVVENRVGAGGNIGADVLAKAAPDGYTLGLLTDTLLTVNPHLYNRMPFDPWKDLRPVTLVANLSQTLVCNGAAPVESLREVVDLAKRQRLTYSYGGPGVPGHLAMELLRFMTSAEMVGVPYKGPAPATQAVIAGEVQCGFLATATVLPHVKAGRLKALAVSTSNRSLIAPHIPTAAEAGVPGYDAPFYLVLFAPGGLAAGVLATVNREIVSALSGTDVKARAAAMDIAVLGTSPEEAATRLRAAGEKWAPVLKRMGMKVN